MNAVQQQQEVVYIDKSMIINRIISMKSLRCRADVLCSTGIKQLLYILSCIKMLLGLRQPLNGRCGG